MADVTVFVDRVVRGDLPGICVVDGVDTDDTLTLRREVSGGARLGVLWLLVLAGPPGWIGLLVLVSLRSGRGELLTVRLPFSETAYRRLQATKRQMVVAWCLLAATAIAGLVVAVADMRVGPTAVASVVVIAAGVVSLLELARGMSRTSDLTVGIELDASRRWVNLRSVHPRFADAAHLRRPAAQPVDGRSRAAPSPTTSPDAIDLAERRGALSPPIRCYEVTTIRSECRVKPAVDVC